MALLLLLLSALEPNMRGSMALGFAVACALLHVAAGAAAAAAAAGDVEAWEVDARLCRREDCQQH
jgi:hypothetical protein